MIFKSAINLPYDFKKSNITSIKNLKTTELVKSPHINLFIKVFDIKVYQILYFRQSDGMKSSMSIFSEICKENDFFLS